MADSKNAREAQVKFILITIVTDGVCTVAESTGEELIIINFV